MRARHEYGKFTTDSIKRSIEFLSKGLELSPNSELLNLAMGYAWFNHGSAVLGADVHDQSLKRAEEYARRVLASNAGSADGKGLLGVVLFDRFETSAGLQLIREGVEAPGRNMDLLTLAALCHSIAGLTRHAEPWTDEIARLDPLHGFSLWTVGMHHLLSGRFEQAELLIRNAHELEPDAPMFRTGLGLVLIYLGRNGGAREVLEAGLEEEPRREVWHVFGRILCHILRQEQEAALQLIDGDLLGDARTDMLFSWFLADCFALLGNPKSSLEWLANAVGGGFLNHSFLKRSDPLVATLGGNEEFEALMTRAQSQFRQIEREAGVPV